MSKFILTTKETKVFSITKNYNRKKSLKFLLIFLMLLRFFIIIIRKSKIVNRNLNRFLAKSSHHYL
jgi:hypothetical protein